MIRTLLLTSTVGFMSSSCYIKLLIALVIAFVFIALFMFVIFLLPSSVQFAGDC